MNIFEHINFSEEIMNNLNNSFVQNEGSTFQNKKEQTIIQTSFLTDILTSINPKVVLETGTHKANFDYFCKLILPEVKIITFGNNVKSQICVDYLNKIFEPYILFVLGDSTVTLSKYNTNNPIDFAWVDGGHTYNVCLSDLKNCARLKIPNICVDDYNRLVKSPVTDFINSTNYKIKSVSTDIRGIVYLKNYDII